MKTWEKRKANKRFLRYIIACIIFTLLCSLVPSEVSAQEKTEKIIRVGFYNMDGYHEQDEDGHRSGYGYEFLQKVGRYLPYRYEYVGYDKSWNEMLEMLENGEIDILTSGGKTPEREERFEYSRNAIGTTVTLIAVRKGNERFTARDYETYEGARIGLLNNSYRNEKFQQFAEEKGFTYIPVYYDTYRTMEQDLQDGIIDGIVSGNLRKIQNELILEQFGQNNFYVMAPKGDREVLDEIDAAIEQLDSDEPGWRAKLQNKYYMNAGTEEISLTAGEEQYFEKLRENHTVLKVLVNPDRSPYSYFEDGEAKGIIPAVFASIADQIGFSYEIIETESREEYYRMLEAGEADLCIDAGFDYSEAEKVGYELTEAYMSTGFSRLTRQDFSGEMKIIASMDRPFLLRDYLEKRYADLDIRYYNSIEECVDAVEKGEADATFLYTYTIQEIMNRDIRNKFTSTIMGGGYASFAVGVRSDCDSCLMTALNKAVANNQRNKIESIIVEKTEALHDDHSLISFLYRNPVYVIIIISVIAVFVLILGIAVTSKRSQKRLQLAYDEVREANNAKRDFLSKMSHDIRTPMNAIIGMTDIVERHIGDEKMIRRYLKKMKMSENYLLTLINEFLDMNKIESGKDEVQKKNFSVKALVNNAADVIRELAVDKEQEIIIDAEGITHSDVLGDERRIEQILINLLSNAVKYTEKKGRILLQVSEEENEIFCFHVKDNGIGISDEYKEHIYEAFSRAEDSRMSRVQGTGLGMTIVKSFVDMLGGTISIDSEVGKGTEFLVRIPLKIIEEEKPECQEQDVSSDTAPKQLTGMHVLIVEDNDLNREIAVEILNSMGITVDCAENGREGVEKFRASEIGTYDVVLMDLQMPVMNGLDACREIRKSCREDAGLPVFAMTANASREDVQNTCEAGMDEHISKPIDIGYLYAVLKKIYDEK